MRFRMRRVAQLKMVLAQDERNGLSELYKMGDVIWERDMVFEQTWSGNFEKDRESNGDITVWCKTDGEKKDRGPNGDVGIEGNSGSDGKGKWSEMVRACVEEGWWSCFEKSVGVWSEEQEEASDSVFSFFFLLSSSGPINHSYFTNHSVRTISKNHDPDLTYYHSFPQRWLYSYCHF